MPEADTLGLKFRDASMDVAKRGLWQLEKLLAASSLVGNPPFFDPAVFPWVKHIEDNWQVIRQELDEVMKYRDDLPNFHDISREGAAGLSDDDRWKTFFFYGYGMTADGNIARCPNTNKLLLDIPGMKTAFFSILAPHKHLAPHRGPYKGVIRYHLGLKIPQPSTLCGIRVKDEVRHWEEGKSLIFDDTYEHEAWNDSDEYRVVLFVDFVRPLKFPASSLNSALIQAISFSPMVMGSKGNQQAWEKRFEAIVNKDRNQEKAQN
jgi:beta-hydroxylase